MLSLKSCPSTHTFSQLMQDRTAGMSVHWELVDILLFVQHATRGLVAGTQCPHWELETKEIMI